MLDGQPLDEMGGVEQGFLYEVAIAAGYFWSGLGWHGELSFWSSHSLFFGEALVNFGDAPDRSGAFLLGDFDFVSHVFSKNTRVFSNQSRLSWVLRPLVQAVLKRLLHDRPNHQPRPTEAHAHEARSYPRAGFVNNLAFGAAVRL